MYEISDPRAVPAQVQLLKDDKQTRGNVISALSEIGSPAIPILA